MSLDPEKKVVAIITARGGSKGLPRKNILKIAGKPMIAYTIEAALECDLVPDVFVTTDSKEIADVAKQYGANVIDRPAALAADTTSSYDTVKHAIEYLREQGQTYEYFVLLQPTSPLRNASHLSDALSAFFRSAHHKCCISVCEAEHSPYKMLVLENGDAKPLFSIETLDAPRQSLDTAYHQNGAIYIMGCNDFLTKTKSFYLEPVLPFIMDARSSIDVDNKDELKIVEYFIQSEGSL